MTINTVCVCGAGTMGSGIAQAAAQSGFPVILYELNQVVLDKAKAGIEKNIQSLVDKGKINAGEKEKIIERIKFTGDISDCKADIFIEAIIEKPESKISLFNQLTAINSPTSIFASNTSSLSVTQIAASVKNPERMIGMHFFNPATLMKLVEVITTKYTDTEVLKPVIELARTMGKTPVLCKDVPGFIVNRVARPYYIESLRMAEEKLADFSLTDRLLEASGFKMGPFRLMDLIGNDINYAVSCSLYEQLNNPERLRPSPIQKEKVETGLLGRKTKKGYYDYE